MRIGPGLILVALTGTGVACSLNSVDRGSRVTIRLEDQSEGPRAAAAEVNSLLSGTPPSTISGFDCIGVNVIGPGIPDSSQNPEPNIGLIFDQLLNQTSYCSYRGILAGPLSATATTPQEIDLLVPPGAPRLVQIVGFKERNGSSDCVREFANLPEPAYTPGVPRQEADVYEIGRAVIGLYQDQTVTVNPIWNSLNSTEQLERELKCNTDSSSPYGSFLPGPVMSTPRGDPAVFYDTRLAPEKIWVMGTGSAETLDLTTMTFTSRGTGLTSVRGAILAPGASTSEVVRIGGVGDPANYSIYNGATWGSTTNPAGASFGYSTPVRATNGNTYFFGGTTAPGNVFSNIGKLLSGASPPVAVSPALTPARARAATAELLAPNAGKIVIAGGITASSSVGTCEIFDTSLETITSCPSALPSPLHDGVLLRAANSGAYFIGGYQAPANTYSDAIYLSNSSVGAWSALTPMSIGRSEFKAFFITTSGVTKILVIGGKTAGGTATATTEIFTIATNSWSPGPSLGVARYGHGAVQTGDGKIYIFGGYTTGGTELDSVEIYSP